MNEPSELLSKLVDAGLGYIWFLVLAIWGGTVNYLERLKRGKVEVFSFVELIGEWSISGFAGLLTAYICVEVGFSWHMTAFLTGISGHQGGRAIHMLETYVKSKFPRVPKDNSNDDNV